MVVLAARVVCMRLLFFLGLSLLQRLGTWFSIAVPHAAVLVTVLVLAFNHVCPLGKAAITKLSNPKL